MKIDLYPEVESYVRQLLDTAPYRDESEVINVALLRMKHADERLAAFRAEIAEAEEQADRGEGSAYTPEYAQEIRVRALARLRATIDAPAMPATKPYKPL
jgi:putative addiction module CopG family antidote